MTFGVLVVGVVEDEMLKAVEFVDCPGGVLNVGVSVPEVGLVEKTVVDCVNELFGV